MKRLILFLIIITLMLLPALSLADKDVCDMSTEELLSLRLMINDELASRVQIEEIPDSTPIADLFPDKTVAKNIRDQLGLFSTADPVTQEQLDRITKVSIVRSDETEVSSIEGIQHLRNLEELNLGYQHITELPEEIGTLTNLTELYLYDTELSVLPDSICNLTNLEVLHLGGSSLVALPDDIGNLSSLKTLKIDHTKITSLPASIRNLQLDEFDREGLDID